MTSKTRPIAAAVAVLLLGFVASAHAAEFCYAYQETYGTGWTDGSTKHDGEIRWASNSGQEVKRGWADFYLITLHSEPTSYQTVKLHYYQTEGTNDPVALLSWAVFAHPLTQSAGVLWDSLGAGFPLGTEPSEPNQWHVVTLPSWTEWPAKIGSDLVVCWREMFPDDDREGAADGWGQQNQPYLEFIAE